MSNRRDFLKMSAFTGAGLLLPWESSATSTVAAVPPLNGTTLPPFVDPLPIPKVAQPVGMLEGVPFYKIGMTQFQQKLHRDLPRTTVWGYDASYPGPTFEARRGHPFKVQWINNLPSKHLFPIDTTVHGSEPPNPAVRTVVHLHGAKIMTESDGFPEAWFTNNYATTGPDFTTKVYTYINDQQATSLWYHDHAMGITRLNVATGLEGFYLLRDDFEDSLNLPKGRYEIPLLFQDRQYKVDGSILYPAQDPNLGDPGFPGFPVPPVWIPEYFGDAALVNGKVTPFLEVEPRKYRFRMLNGSNARFYHMTLIETTESGIPLAGTHVPVFNQIGTDGGLLPAPVPLTEFLMAPAERQDVIIDFTHSYGKCFVIANDARAPYPDGDDPTNPNTPGPSRLMMFKVKRPLCAIDTSSLPSRLLPISLMSPATAMKQRFLTLTELDSDAGNPIFGQLGDFSVYDANSHSQGSMFMDPVTETPRAGSTEIWNIYNLTGDAHPIHVHLVQFQVLNRQNILMDGSGNLILDKHGKPQADPAAPLTAPDSNERPAWKDTVKTYPGNITRIIAKFDLPDGVHLKPGERAKFLWHCHILDHEDNEMMRPFEVVG